METDTATGDGWPSATTEIMMNMTQMLSTDSEDDKQFEGAGFIILFNIPLLMVIIITSNLVVILAVKRTKELQTITNAFVVNLAIADLLIGLHTGCTIPSFAFSGLTKNSIFCKIQIWFSISLSATSLVTLLGKSS